MRSVHASHAAFAAFGLFWGTWGAGLPALRDAAGVGPAGLGTALLFVGLGALPGMAFTGRAVDALGARLAGPLLVALAGAGVVTAAVARDLPTLAAGMALVGATSGAADVAANAQAGLAERRSGRRVITLSHGVFSAFVVVGSLGTGALRAAGAGVVVVFAAAGALMAACGVAALVLGDRPQPADPEHHAPPGRRVRALLPFVAVGLVAALGFAMENAHQSWSAVYLGDVLGAGPGTAALAPATFAACAAATRFVAGSLTRAPATLLLVGGASTALVGSLLLAVAPTVPLALAALSLAAVGTSLLFPTLLSRATQHVPPDQRGRATSAVATTAYLGFLLGPVYVGTLAGAAGLRGAMIGVAALALAFSVLAPLRVRRPPVPPRPAPPAPHRDRAR
jgi:predicted MFS family arabinose efflux permease